MLLIEPLLICDFFFLVPYVVRDYCFQIKAVSLANGQEVLAEIDGKFVLICQDPQVHLLVELPVSSPQTSLGYLTRST